MSRPSSSQLVHSYYKRKQARSGGFSLGALARQTKLSVSNLSRIFAGKRKLQLRHLDSLSRALEIDELGRAEIREQLLRERIGEEQLESVPRAKELSAQAPPLELAPESFHFLLEKWHYLAVLELVTCEDFRFDPRWVASRLGIQEAIAEEALERLRSRHCIAEVDGRWVKCSERIRFPSGKEILLYNRYQKENLKKAMQGLSSVDEAALKARLVLGGTVAVNSRNLGKAREILNRAVVEAMQVLCEGECDQVYQLSAALIPLTKPKPSAQ